jgi:hypothetical protein
MGAPEPHAGTASAALTRTDGSGRLLLLHPFAPQDGILSAAAPRNRAAFALNLHGSGAAVVARVIVTELRMCHCAAARNHAAADDAAPCHWA